MVVCLLTAQINDFNIEGISAKSTAMLNLVKSLKAQGVPIDGIGLQAHLTVGEVPSTLQANMEQFTALGIEIAITELDIRMTMPSTPTLLEQQKQDYQTVISACKAVPDCIGVTIWDYTDRVSSYYFINLSVMLSKADDDILSLVLLDPELLSWTRSSLSLG